jgi:hypothetical protein
MDAEHRAGPVGLLPRASGPVELDTRGLTADITHPDWPIPAGSRLAVERSDGEAAVVRTEITVLVETVTVACGIEARVVHDLVTRDGALVRDTLDWYAQDAEGNVWHLGEQTAAFAAGRVVTTHGSWEAGADGARARIVLPALRIGQHIAASRGWMSCA